MPVGYCGGPQVPTFVQYTQCTGWARKRGHRLMTTILSSLNQYYLQIFTGRFFSRFAVKWILKIPPHLAYVAALLCETLMSPKQTINDKLQGSVATYLRCGGVVNSQIKKGLLLSVWVNFFKRWTFGKVTSKSVVVSCTLCAWPTHC